MFPLSSVFKAVLAWAVHSCQTWRPASSAEAAVYAYGTRESERKSSAPLINLARQVPVLCRCRFRHGSGHENTEWRLGAVLRCQQQRYRTRPAVLQWGRAESRDTVTVGVLYLVESAILEQSVYFWSLERASRDARRVRTIA